MFSTKLHVLYLSMPGRQCSRLVNGITISTGGYIFGYNMKVAASVGSKNVSALLYVLERFLYSHTYDSSLRKNCIPHRREQELEIRVRRTLSYLHPFVKQWNIPVDIKG